MRDGSYVDVSDHYPPDDSVRVWSSQELRGYGSAAAADWPGGAPGGDLPPWVHVRLTFGDGAALDVLAAASEGRIVVDDPRVEAAPEPPHPWPGDFDGSYGYGGYIGYGGYDDPPREAVPAPAPVPLAEPVPPPPPVATRRARPSLPRGSAGRRAVADTYRAAQDEGRDPVLAVMCATGRSRRKSLKLIAGARDEGYLTPRHHRR